MIFAAAKQALQHAIALSGYFVVLSTLVVVFPAVVRSATVVAFDGINGGRAACGRGIVTEHVAPGALDQGWAIPAMNECDLSTKHVDTLLGGLLGDEVTFVNICDEDSGGLLPGEDWVALPVRRGTDEGLCEARVGGECVEKILWGPDKTFLVNSGYVAELGPRPTVRWYQVCFRAEEWFAKLSFVFQQLACGDEAGQDIREVAGLVIVHRPRAVEDLWRVSR
jgi:hypothetical protein